MKKTILSIVFIISVFYSFAQIQVDTAYSFEVVTMEQDTFNLEEFWAENPDTKVALEFFFADSPLCRETSPMINDAYKRFGCNEHDVFFLSINVSDDSATVAHYRDTLGIETPMVLAANGGSFVDSLYQVHAYPSFVLLQKEFFTPESDTVFTDDTEDDIDTIYTYNDTQFTNKDIWPIEDADSLVNMLLSYDLMLNECSGEGQNNPSGIAESKKKNPALYLYPNPASEQVNLVSSELEGYFTLEILDISGKTIIRRNEFVSKNNPVSIYTQSLEAGLYVFRLSSSQESYSEKLMIQ